jgi:thymidylate synthase
VNHDDVYLDLVEHVLENGEPREDRTGVGTRSVFGTQSRYDLRRGFPLLTTKRMNFDLVARELLWFLSGSTNANDLGPAAKLWSPWAAPNGDLGPVYGAMWRGWRVPTEVGFFDMGVDQISQVISGIKTDPYSRRHIVSAWNPSVLDQQALPPCHVLFQYYVSTNGHLDCQLYQRSADLAIGVPFNVASYALLTEMVAEECGLIARFFIHSIGDAHLYENHLPGIREQLARDRMAAPYLRVAKKPVLEQTLEDLVLEGYDPHPFIRFEVAV